MQNSKQETKENKSNNKPCKCSDDCSSQCKIIKIESTQKLLLINLDHSNESDYCIVDANSKIEKDSLIIIDSKYGKDLAKVLGEVLSISKIPENHLVKVIREASEKDIAKFTNNKKREAEALKTCIEKIKKHKLAMKLVSAHYLVDEAKILFFFTAETRVDFRELVKDLVTIFKTRIELRQIGVRDESRILGGLAVCGRDYCCHSVTDHLKPVSIKMAKEQNLSLNSMKISGPCGRLLCCLSYEYDFYKDEKKKFPSYGHQIVFDGKKMKVIETNVVSRIIKLYGQDGQYVSIPFDKLKYLERNNKWIIKKGKDGLDLNENKKDKEVPSIELNSFNSDISINNKRNTPISNSFNVDEDNSVQTKKKFDNKNYRRKPGNKYKN